MLAGTAAEAGTQHRGAAALSLFASVLNALEPMLGQLYGAMRGTSSVVSSSSSSSGRQNLALGRPGLTMPGVQPESRVQGSSRAQNPTGLVNPNPLRRPGKFRGHKLGPGLIIQVPKSADQLASSSSSGGSRSSRPTAPNSPVAALVAVTELTASAAAAAAAAAVLAAQQQQQQEGSGGQARVSDVAHLYRSYQEFINSERVAEWRTKVNLHHSCNACNISCSLFAAVLCSMFTPSR